MTLVCRPFHFFLDIRYRFSYSPFCVILCPSGSQPAAFFLSGRLSPRISPLECAVPRNDEFCTILVQISPLDSALTDSPPISPVECALTETGGRGGPRESGEIQKSKR